MHRFLRLADDVELSLAVGPPDPGPQVGMARHRVDGDRTLRCIKTGAEHHGTQHLGVERIDLLKRLRKQMQLEIG